MKFSKNILIMIGAGIFIMVTAGLVMVTLRQIDSKNELTKQLAAAQNRLQGIQIDTLAAQQVELEKKLIPSASQANPAKTEFPQPVTSTAVATAIFDTANAFGLLVNGISSTSPATEILEGVSLSAISVTAELNGNASNTTDFIRSINNSLLTSAVKSIEMTATTSGNVTTIVKLIIYSKSEH